MTSVYLVTTDFVQVGSYGATQISILQNMERGKSEERPVAFSPFNFPVWSDKEKTLGK